jgi:hypothetical protein
VNNDDADEYRDDADEYRDDDETDADELDAIVPMLTLEQLLARLYIATAD